MPRNLSAAYSESVDRINLALGALAVALGAAILAVVFVPEQAPSPAVGSDSSTSTSLPAPTSTTDAPTSTATPVTGQEAPFAMPASLDGVWASQDAGATAEFSGTRMTSFQAVVGGSGQSVGVSLSEPALLALPPTRSAPVEAVLFLVVETSNTVSRPTPVLGRLTVQPDGLHLQFELNQSAADIVLRPR